MRNVKLQSLHDAVSDSDVSTVRALLDQGTDVNGVDERGLTALHRAVWEGRSEVVRVLMEGGADVNARRVVGDVGNAWTPLHLAAENDQPRCARLLLAAGAETDPEDEYGQTPLMIAVDEMKSPDVARFLIEYGADGRRALAWASPYSDGPGSEIVELLKRAAAGGTAP